MTTFVDNHCYEIESNEENVGQMGVLPCISSFAECVDIMESFIKEESRDLVDQAYTEIVRVMFATLEKIARTDLKDADVFLLENYGAFANSCRRDLAAESPALEEFYHQASKSYEQASTRHISMIINYQFGPLFQFHKKIEDLICTIAPEEIPFQLGLSKTDLREVLKASLSGVNKSIQAMYTKLQKSLTLESELSTLWYKCKVDFLDKYESFVQLVAKVYPTESIPSVEKLRNDGWWKCKA